MTTAGDRLDTAGASQEHPPEGPPNQPDMAAVARFPEDLLSAFSRDPPWLPCKYLYLDSRGANLYEDVVELPTYYLFKEECRLLENHAREVVNSHMSQDAVIVELGCGSARKTSLVLNAFAHRHGISACRYAGIDVSADALDMAASMLLQAVPGMKREQMHLEAATYLEGLQAVRDRYPPATPLFLMWLGSSIGNFNHQEAVQFLQQAVEAAGPHSQLLLCTDLWKDSEVLRMAYDDPAGVSEAFIRNGMTNALRAVGHPAAHEPDWQPGCHSRGGGDGRGASAGAGNGGGNGSGAMAGTGDGGGGGHGDAGWLWDYQVEVNDREQQVEMWVVARRCVPGLLDGGTRDLPAGGQVLVEISRKFSPAGLRRMALQAGMHIQDMWTSPAYSMQLLLPPAGAMRHCWAATDRLFDGLPSERDWLARPIDLRHPLGFYYGHVASFAKAKMVPELHGSCPLDAPFVRGMDPDVEDPSRCHDHPPPPEVWPSRGELQEYVHQVRELLLLELAAGRCNNTRMIAISQCLEHEYMHQETLAYLLAQLRKSRFEQQQQQQGKIQQQGKMQQDGKMQQPEKEVRSESVMQQHNSRDSAATDASPAQPTTPERCAGQSRISSTARRAVRPPPVKGRVGGKAALAALGRGGAAATTSGREAVMGREEDAVATNCKPVPRGMPPSPPAAAAGATPVAAAKTGHHQQQHVLVPGGTVVLGCGDQEEGGAFVWDNEAGSTGSIQVGPLLVDVCPVSIAQFREFALLTQHHRPQANGSNSTTDSCRGTNGEANGGGGNREGGEGHGLCPFPSLLPATWSVLDGVRVVVHTDQGSNDWQEVAGQPVYCSLAQAQEYCSWRGPGWRVMTEAEYVHLSSCASDRVLQLAGGGWEWTSSKFGPLPGFLADPSYPEYSTDFFDNKHYVLRGWSPATPAAMRHHRADTFRNFYQRLYPYAFAKFRCCRDA